MKTSKLEKEKIYRYNDNKVTYIGEKSNCKTFFEFKSKEDNRGVSTVYPLWEHEVNESVTEINVIKELKTC